MGSGWISAIFEKETVVIPDSSNNRAPLLLQRRERKASLLPSEKKMVPGLRGGLERGARTILLSQRVRTRTCLVPTLRGLWAAKVGSTSRWDNWGDRGFSRPDL